jgi:hypothetical protein
VYSIEEIANRILHQDNAFTADPMFLVEQEDRIYGIDPDYDPQIAWLHADECVEVNDKELLVKLDAEYEDTGGEPEGYRRVGYAKRWTYVNCFFTRAAAEQFIKNRGHDYRYPLRVYVDSAYRNPEWRAVVKHVLGLQD